jgi:mRNA-decapping enzyme subunit 2
LPQMDRSEELKRLLSIGGPSASANGQFQQPQPQTSQANHLLAMLQGGTRGAPQTPMDQVNAFMPPQPESPHPRHPRQPPSGYQQPPPQFPLSPQQGQQGGMPFPPQPFGQQQGNLRQNGAPLHPLQQDFHHQLQDMAGMPPGPRYPNPNGFYNNSTMQTPQFQQQQNMPGMPPGSRYPSHNGSGHPSMHNLPAQHPTQQMQPSRQTPIPGPQMQGQHGAIASGPSAPNASQLPPPRLSAQSVNLLNAFKTGQRPVRSTPSSSAAPRSGSVHQSALLGLFKSSPAPEPAQPSVQDPRSEHAIVSPAPEEVVQRPAVLQERRPTLNEITRSLPVNFKTKRPSQHSPALPTQLTNAAPQTSQPSTPAVEAVSIEVSEPEQPIARQQRAPAAKPQSPANVPKTRLPNVPKEPREIKETKEPKPRDPQTSTAKHIMQRAGSRQPPGRAQRDKPASPSPARQSKSKASDPPAPMTILTRPGSARMKSGSPSSETSKQAFQPQLLRRHDASDSNAASTNGHSDARDGATNGEGNGKRDQLLALFSKSPAVSQTPPQASPAATPTPPVVASPPPQAPAPTNNHLLNILNAATAPPKPAARSTPSPAPPSAPAIQPTHRPANSRSPAPPPIVSHPQQQNSLLDLFKRPSHAASPSMESPMSPFTLGSPHGMRHGRDFEQVSKSRLGSVVSEGSRRGSGTGMYTGSGGNATPTEQKDFLLGFLNGVVQKEGRK